MNNRVVFNRSQYRWQPHEASRNWLALGLLLAAWNAAEHVDQVSGSERRPDALRGYPQVSVRALQRLK